MIRVLFFSVFLIAYAQSNSQNVFDTCGLSGEKLFLNITNVVLNNSLSKDIISEGPFSGVGHHVEIDMDGNSISYSHDYKSIEYGYSKFDEELYYYIDYRTENSDTTFLDGKITYIYFRYWDFYYVRKCGSTTYIQCSNFKGYSNEYVYNTNGSLIDIEKDSSFTYVCNDEYPNFINHKVILGELKFYNELPEKALSINDFVICNCDGCDLENNTFTPLSKGLGSAATVYAIEEYEDNKILIGGDNFRLDGDPSRNQILATWDGTKYEEFSNAVIEDGAIYDIEYHQGKIYIGGSFTNINGDNKLAHFAIYENGVWYTPDGGLNDRVYDIYILNDEVFIGGSFKDAGGNSKADNITLLMDNKFHDLGTGPNGAVRSLWHTTNELYVGGIFTSVNNTLQVSGLAKYKNGVWSQASPNWKGDIDVYSLSYRDNRLYIGSSGIRNIGPNQFNRHNISYLENDQIVDIGTDIDSRVFAIEWHDGQLWIGGDFEDAGGDSKADHIAKFNNGNWQPVSTELIEGTSFVVVDIESTNHGVYLGGDFNNIGGNQYAHKIAKLNCTNINSTYDEIYNQLNLFPNPTAGVIEVEENELLDKISIINSNGVIVKEYKQDNNELDLSHLPSGVYIIKSHSYNGSVS